jgi:hypothetical protein
MKIMNVKMKPAASERLSSSSSDANSIDSYIESLRTQAEFLFVEGVSSFTGNSGSTESLLSASPPASFTPSFISFLVGTSIVNLFFVQLVLSVVVCWIVYQLQKVRWRRSVNSVSSTGGVINEEHVSKSNRGNASENAGGANQNSPLLSLTSALTSKTRNEYCSDDCDKEQNLNSTNSASSTHILHEGIALAMFDRPANSMVPIHSEKHVSTKHVRKMLCLCA